MIEGCHESSGWTKWHDTAAAHSGMGLSGPAGSLTTATDSQLFRSENVRSSPARHYEVIKNPDTDFTFIRIPPSGVDPGASTMQRIQHFNSTTSYKQRFYHRAFRRPTRMKEEEKKSGLTVHRKLIMISTNFHQRF
ncbi:hypothetical protein AVEN_88611-1 [Araneus ventricosus]|uniref:Uncharacterized protein n=1 Tax=Araneus ventricosus TaxID=182803 RepID=A0A4Y2FPA9_ARAVE|nr:hypothetical protein AVEN_88611-1 [Araneus ventricosus]